MGVLDSHTALNKLQHQFGINNSLAGITGGYKKARTLNKIIMEFGIHCPFDLKQYLSPGMEHDKAWASWRNFHDRSFAQKHKDKVMDQAIDAYVKDGVKGMLHYIYFRFRKGGSDVK